MDEEIKKRTIKEIPRFKCPICGKISWSVTVNYKDGGEFGICSLCGKDSPIDNFELFEQEEEVIICPICKDTVTLTEENWSYANWAGPEPLVICPKCKVPLQGYFHHERPNGPTIEVITANKGGYQHIFHKDCPLKEGDEFPFMELKRINLDTYPEDIRSEKGASVVVLVFECETCGDQQVIKHTLLDTRVWDSTTDSWWFSYK